MAALVATHALALYLAAATALILTPGPDTLYVLSRGVAGGRRTGVLAASGVATGILVHTTAATLGLAALLRTSATAYALVRYVGAAYLLYLGARALSGRDDAFDDGGPGHADPTGRSDGPNSGDGRAGTPLRAYLRGVTVNVLNPKVALFFLAFLPQFAGTGDGAAATMLLLGAIYATITLCYLGGVGALSGGVGDLFRANPRLSRGLQGVSGVFLVALGAVLALNE